MSTQPTPLAIDVRDLRFGYRGEPVPVLRGLDLAIGPGVRCLLVGKNGAGKTTLLSVLAGRHMIPDETVRVLGRPAFSDTSLVRDVSFIGGTFPFDVDLRVREILDAVKSLDVARCDRLCDVLGVDREWRMCRVSDGQRRRVQILLGLLRPSSLLLLDEVTTDLDVIARTDLLRLLREETEARGTTIVYATHILDGLETWASHIAWLDEGRIRLIAPLAEVAELLALREARVPSPLLRLVEGWFRGTVVAR